MLKEKWILDTDIGNDSDDCMAIGYLLARDDIDLIGITTVSGEAHRRALFIDTICSLAGKSIPISRGNEKSLDGSCVQSVMGKTQSAQADRYPHRDLPDKNNAVLLLKQLIEENPHEVTLCCIGQLTNAALLFATYPHIPSLLKRMVIMGGRFEENESFDIKKWGIVEWNIKCDPFAAKIVFDANIKEVYVSGIEHTHKFRKDAPMAAQKIRAIPYMAPVADAIENNKDLWFHDPVAIWAMLHKDELKWKKGDIHVDLQNENMGYTTFTENKDGKHIVLADIDVERFFESYASQMNFNWD